MLWPRLQCRRCAGALQGGERLPKSRLHFSSQARENVQCASSTSKWLMRGGSWRFIVQYNRIAEQNTIKGRQPYPRNINLAGLWSTWGLLHETPWPGEGRGFQLHLLTLSRAAASIGSPSYSRLAGSPASWLSLRSQDICPGDLDAPVGATTVMTSPSQSGCLLCLFFFFYYGFHSAPPFCFPHPPTCSPAPAAQGSRDGWYSPSLCVLMVPWLVALFGLTSCQSGSEDA